MIIFHPCHIIRATSIQRHADFHAMLQNLLFAGHLLLAV